MQPKYNIYVDGSYTTKAPDRVGWSVVVEAVNNPGTFIYKQNGVITDPSLVRTRQVAGELKAAIFAAELAASLNDMVEIMYDYEGIREFIEGTWRLKTSMAKAYYKVMIDVYSKGLVKFTKVDAHTNIPGNDEADRLAKAAIWGEFYGQQ